MSVPSFERLRVETSDGVATVTIDAPPLNHFSIGLARELSTLCHWLRRTDDARVVLVQSAIDDFFIPHLDLEDLDNLSTPPEPLRSIGMRLMEWMAHCGPPARWLNQLVLCKLSPYHAALEAVSSLPQITIAVIEGRVGGIGSELALCADMRFGDCERAVLNQLEASFGLFPGAGGTQRLALLLGEGRAHEIVASSMDIDATTGERWGYYNRVLPAGEVRPFANALARRIARFPRDGVRTGKRLVRRARPPSRKALQLEAVHFMRGMYTAPVRERLEAFLAAGGQRREGASRLADLL